MATVRMSFLLGGERFHGRLNRSSVLSDIPAKATRLNRAGPGYKVIRLRRLSHTRQALQSSYPRPKSLDLLKRVVAVLPRWELASGRQQPWTACPHHTEDAADDLAHRPRARTSCLCRWQVKLDHTLGAWQLRIQ